MGAIVMALGTVSCSASGTNSASQSTTTACSTIACDKATFQRALQTDPRDQYAAYNLGIIAQGDSDTKTAQADFLKAIAIDPKFESALYQEGLLRFHANDVSAAITYLTRAVTENGKDSCAHWALGYALRRSGGPTARQRATAQLRAALKLDPALIKGIGAPKVKPNEVPGCD